MNKIENISEYLLNYQIKPSMQRLAIMEYLLANRIHPTAEDVYHALYPKIPTLSKTTVYNTLNLFVAQGALRMLVIDEKMSVLTLTLPCMPILNVSNVCGCMIYRLKTWIW